MTGIERLRALAYKKNFLEPAEARELDAIADQIEREQGERVSCMRVLAVVTEMERHVSGVEGAEDSPVARWARELREALGGDGRDPAADTTVDAYDLLPQDERDAITWVREHGGLDAVRDKWDGRVDVDAVSRMVEAHKAKRERLKAHALGLERKCAERGETIRELSGKAAKQSDEIRVMRDAIAETCARLGVEGTGSTVDDAQVIWREISRRLMPEGMEWPRFEDGELVRIGDKTNDIVVRSVVFQETGVLVIDGTSLPGWNKWRRYKEPFPRPAPKVLDADGVEIREGDTVYYVDGREQKVNTVARLAPVLAADGRPLRKGEHVYHIETGAELVVKKLPKPGEYQAVVVFALPTSPASHLTSFDPDQLTHERPESKCRDCAHWQKDPTANNMGVCWFFYHEREGQDCYAARLADIGACEEFMPRARALTGDA